MTADRSPSPPPAVLAAGGVFLPAEVCERLWRILRDHLTARLRDGGQVRPEIADALAVLRAAALAHLSAYGHLTRTSADIGTSSAPAPPLVTTAELAARLGVSERHARRLAHAEGITPAARGSWTAEDAAALAAHRRR
ncbi:hypothetical protein [Crossiella sp. CA198]|uniref:hypothetical protein n=1 Tax=Crossiella sp. CA198 TaxID=3455607 RepID=UPI003F8CF6A9